MICDGQQMTSMRGKGSDDAADQKNESGKSGSKEGEKQW